MITAGGVTSAIGVLGTDVAQETTITIDDLLASVTTSAGEIYNLSVSLKDGTDLVPIEYVSPGGQTAALGELGHAHGRARDAALRRR